MATLLFRVEPSSSAVERTSAVAFRRPAVDSGAFDATLQLVPTAPARQTNSNQDVARERAAGVGMERLVTVEW